MTLFDERRKPTRSGAATRPSLTFGTAEFRRDLAPLHRAGTPAGAPGVARAAVVFTSQARQLLLQLTAPLTEPLVDVGSQRKQSVDVHASQVQCGHFGLPVEYGSRFDRTIQPKR